MSKPEGFHSPYRFLNYFMKEMSMKKLILITGIMILLMLLSACFSMMTINDGSSTQTTDSGKSDEPEKSSSFSIEGLENILSDPGFEDDGGEWTPFGYCTVELTTDVAHSGTGALYVSNRMNSWEGAGINLLPLVEKGATYVFVAWVMIEDTSAGVTITVKRTTSFGDNYDQLLSAQGVAGEWIEVMGEYTIDPHDQSESLTLYVEGPPPETNFYIDDVKLVKTGM
jgi:hypothetical protein